MTETPITPRKVTLSNRSGIRRGTELSSWCDMLMLRFRKDLRKAEGCADERSVSPDSSIP